jgi:hypothetical protein
MVWHVYSFSHKKEERMKNVLFPFLLLFVVFLIIPGVASSAIVIDLYGDKDGFGIGILPDESYDYTPSFIADDLEDIGTITDDWIQGDQIFSHTYDISGLGPVTSASLEIFTFGQGWHGVSQLYIDDNYVGDLTDGDNSGIILGDNFARLDIFDLTSYASILTGGNTIRIDTAGIDNDNWALDYSELEINTVPIPGAVWLLGSGLVGLIAVRRRNTK